MKFEKLVFRLLSDGIWVIAGDEQGPIGLLDGEPVSPLSSGRVDAGNKGGWFIFGKAPDGLTWIDDRLLGSNPPASYHNYLPLHTV